MLEDHNIKIDGVDNNLKCRRLQWHRNSSGDDTFNAGKEFGLSPVDSIRGVAHIFNGDTELDLISKNVNRRKEIDKLSMSKKV